MKPIAYSFMLSVAALFLLFVTVPAAEKPIPLS